MRTIATLTVLAIAALTLNAQVPVKKDLMQMLGKIPAPPSSVKDAFSKVATKNPNGTFNYNAEMIFGALEKESMEVETEIGTQMKADAGSAMPATSPENAKKMSDPELRKKMKSMTKEERMKMAMEMMKSAPTPGSATTMDPPPIRAALDEWQKVYNDTQNEFQRSAAEQQEELKLSETYEKSHSDIQTWESAEIAKLPQISSGEMSAPDPARVKQVKLKSADKHIAMADKRLEQIRARWGASMDRARTRYASFHQKLVEADYAAATKNFSTRKVLSDAQLTILKEVQHHLQRSRSAWEESASWQGWRAGIEMQ